MKRIDAPLIAAAVAAMLLAVPAENARAVDVPVPAPDKLAAITAFFANEVATGKLPGAVILIQQHGKPVYLKSFGVQDVKTGAPMTPDTIFAVHSMTKPVTSLAAMMLIDEGKIALSDPLSKYIPSFANVKVGVDIKNPDGTDTVKLVPPNHPITILDLMRHTSGITYDYIGGKWVEKAYQDAHIFADPSTTRSSPSASPDCRLRVSRERCGAMAIRPTYSAASSRSSRAKRSTIS